MVAQMVHDRPTWVSLLARGLVVDPAERTVWAVLYRRRCVRPAEAATEPGGVGPMALVSVRSRRSSPGDDRDAPVGNGVAGTRRIGPFARDRATNSWGANPATAAGRALWACSGELVPRGGAYPLGIHIPQGCIAQQAYRSAASSPGGTHAGRNPVGAPRVPPSRQPAGDGEDVHGSKLLRSGDTGHSSGRGCGQGRTTSSW